ncbi:T-complex 10 C-terminal domain-containing protein [Nocardia sp. CNY236]|nr:T-complex 10 C-terminal domain-containing protein [Nocardia sp. CNY236]
MHSALEADGTIHTTYPDGRTARTVQLADGRVVAEFEDGSGLSCDPE